MEPCLKSAGGQSVVHELCNQGLTRGSAPDSPDDMDR